MLLLCRAKHRFTYLPHASRWLSIIRSDLLCPKNGMSCRAVFKMSVGPRAAGLLDSQAAPRSADRMQQCRVGLSFKCLWFPRAPLDSITFFLLCPEIIFQKNHKSQKGDTVERLLWAVILDVLCFLWPTVSPFSLPCPEIIFPKFHKSRKGDTVESLLWAVILDVLCFLWPTVSPFFCPAPKLYFEKITSPEKVILSNRSCGQSFRTYCASYGRQYHLFSALPRNYFLEISQVPKT
jgi:hypothetical protein